MEYEKIKKLMDDMGKSNLTAISIDFPDGTKISMKKEITAVNNIAKEVPADNKKAEITETKEEKKGHIVKSPIVGTFYMKPSPTSEPYVEIGTNVKEGDTLCIIEAMKLMNEIQSEYTGKVTKILVEDGSTVEYGTELFVIE